MICGVLSMEVGHDLWVLSVVVGHDLWGTDRGVLS